MKPYLAIMRGIGCEEVGIIPIEAKN